jgi:hypothetical protein
MDITKLGVVFQLIDQFGFFICHCLFVFITAFASPKDNPIRGLIFWTKMLSAGTK